MTQEIVAPDVSAAMAEAYQSHSSEVLYKVDRSFYPRDSQDPYYYLFHLPSFRRVTADQIVVRGISEDQPLRILDVGCGKGRALEDLRRRWLSKVRCSGITAHPYHLGGGFLSREVDIRQGDAQHLEEYFSPGSFDLVMSVYTAAYLADPWTLVRGSYKILKEGGMALIGNFPHRIVSGSQEFKEHMEVEYDMELKFQGLSSSAASSVAFVKTAKPIEVPLTPIGMERDVRFHHPMLFFKY